METAVLSLGTPQAQCSLVQATRPPRALQHLDWEFLEPWRTDLGAGLGAACRMAALCCGSRGAAGAGGPSGPQAAQSWSQLEDKRIQQQRPCSDPDLHPPEMSGGEGVRMCGTRRSLLIHRIKDGDERKGILATWRVPLAKAVSTAEDPETPSDHLAFQCISRHTAVY